MKRSCLFRFRHAWAAAFAVAAAVLGPNVLAAAITGNMSSNGMQLQVRALDPGGVAAVDEIDKYIYVEGGVGSSALRVFGSGSAEHDALLPVDFDVAIGNSFSRAIVEDDTGQGTVELRLERPAIHPELEWFARSTSRSYFRLSLSPRSELTIATLVTGEFLDPYGTETSPSIDAHWLLSIATETAPGTSRYASFGEWSELSVTNTAAEPVMVWFTSQGELNARLQPVPEPAAFELLGLGLLVLGAVAFVRKRRTGEPGAAQVPRKHARKALHRWAGSTFVLAFTLPIGVAGHAQSVDVNVRLGAVIGSADTLVTPASHSWSELTMHTRVGQYGYPHTDRTLLAVGTVPYPLEIATRSGSSWTRIAIDDPTALAHFDAHIDASGIEPGASSQAASYLWGSIEATYANIVVPAYSIARIVVDIAVTPDASADLPYEFNASLASQFDYNAWSTSSLEPSRHVLSSPYYIFDNSSGATARDTGPVYFLAGIGARMHTTPVPEPSVGLMTLSGLLLLGGAVRRRCQSDRAAEKPPLRNHHRGVGAIDEGVA